MHFILELIPLKQRIDGYEKDKKSLAEEQNKQEELLKDMLKLFHGKISIVET